MAEEFKDLSSLKNRAQIVYILYAIGLFFWISVIAGVILAYLMMGRARELSAKLYEDQFSWQINSFWGLLAFLILPFIGLLVGFLSHDFGVISTLAILSTISVFAGIIWFVYRIVKGWLALRDEKPLYNE